MGQFSVFWIYNIFHTNRTPTVHTTYPAPDTLFHSSALVPELHLYIMLPGSLSVVNTACVMYGNVGHLLVVLFGIRPQVEVNDCWVDAACLRVSLLHQLAKTVFDQLHRPNRTTSDLDLSPVSRTEQLACQTSDMKIKKKLTLFLKDVFARPERHPRACSLTILQGLHQSIRVSQCSKVDESLGNPIVSKHGEPVNAADVSLSSGLHDAPEVCHQDLSSLVEWDSLPL